MKSINVTEPSKKAEATVVALICGFVQRKIPGKPPIRFVRLKLSGPLNGATSINFNPGEPGFDDLASALDIETAIGNAVAKRFKGAEVKALPTKEPKEPKEPKKTGKKIGKKTN